MTPHILAVLPEDPPDGMGGVRAKVLELIPAINSLVDVHAIAYGDPGLLSQHPEASRSVKLLPLLPRSVPRRAAAVIKRRFPSSAAFDPGSLTDALHSYIAHYGIPNVIHVEGSMLLHLGVEIRRVTSGLSPKPTLVASISDSRSLALRHPPSATSVARSSLAQLIEAKSYRAFDIIQVVSTRDKEWLNQRIPKSCVHVIPLGVTLPIVCQTEPPTNVVGHLGSLQGNAGLEVATFLTSSWHLVQSLVPSAQLLLAGPPPKRELRALMDVTPAVTYVGVVSDGDAFLQSCTMAIAPSQKLSGMATKALQAMANCRAVAGGRVLNGLPGGHDGLHYLRGDTATELAHAIVFLLLEPERRIRIAKNGRLLAQQLSWHAAADTYVRSIPSL